MPKYACLASLLAISGLVTFCRAEKPDKLIRKAVERSTLNQPGTVPFHLKAQIAPSLDRDRGSNRYGEVEIWWASPTQWKREVRSPEFHQIAIMNGSHEWQKNEGDYFPYWLRKVTEALIDPVPNLNQVLEQVETGEVRKAMGSTYFSWISMSTDGSVTKGMGCTLALTDSPGLLYYGGCLGWGGLYKDYRAFHGREVARVVSSGSPEVTAKITTLEDLRDVLPSFFEPEAKAADSQNLRTVVIEEGLLRKNLQPVAAVVWPALQNGPLEGVLTTEVIVDRAGNVREVGTIVSDNPGIDQAARKAIVEMKFAPYLQDGMPVQVVSRITMPFRTERPQGTESFASARTYFERGRQVGFPAWGNRPPYVLRAEFQAKIKNGTIEKGQYEDTWESDSEWRREARIGNSRYVRARRGEKHYELAEGPDAPLLKLVLKFLEPIPAIDTFIESDWRIERDLVQGAKTIRVLTGYESPEGALDPEHARGYWFDDAGRLVKTYFQGLETSRSEFADAGGAEVAHQIKVLKSGSLAMVIRVTEMRPVTDLPAGTFELPGHEWTRAFTDEVR